MRRLDGKYRFILRNAFLAFFVFIYSFNFVFASSSNLVVSEIMYNPDGSDSDREWIELVNIDDEKIEIESIKKYKEKYVLNLRSCTEKDDEECEKSNPIYYKNEELKISEDEIVIITSDADEFENSYSDFDGEILESNFSLKNGDDEFIGIYREDKDENLEWLERLDYSSDWGGDGNGKSLERINLTGSDSKKNWAESWLAGGTPGEKYSEKKPEFPKGLKVSELFPNPEGDESDEEFIEIFNNGDEDIDLSGWSLQDGSGKNYYFDKDKELKKQEYLVVFRGDSKISLNNDGDKVKILNPVGDEMDEIEYDDTIEGQSFALNFKNKKFKWTSIVTPGEKNEFPKKKKYSDKVRFNEILSNPEGQDDDAEWVELKNNDDSEVDLTGWKIENSREQIFEIEDEEIKKGKLGVIEIKNTSFSIRNSKEKLKLIDPNGDVVDSIEIPESASSGASFNLGEDGRWSWNKNSTPGKKNRINHLPKIKIDIPDEFYKDMKMEFDASGTKDEDGDELKFRWEFGDGHRSYLKKTTHKYEDEGRFLVVLRVDDGSVYAFKEFEIEVEKYPEREIKIVKFIPNPVGKDSEKEIIWLKNETKEKVNLRGWSVATGSSMSKLTNHPIYEDFEIDSGEVEELDRDDCKFSLLNKKGRVVLRYPNGETADKVKYEKEKIAEGEIWEIRDGELVWIGGEAVVGKEVFTEFENSDKIVEEGIDVRGVSFQEQLLKAVLNEDLRCCETLQKMMVDNWKYQNRIWLRFNKISFIA